RSGCRSPPGSRSKRGVWTAPIRSTPADEPLRVREGTPSGACADGGSGASRWALRRSEKDPNACLDVRRPIDQLPVAQRKAVDREGSEDGRQPRFLAEVPPVSVLDLLPWELSGRR